MLRRSGKENSNETTGLFSAPAEKGSFLREFDRILKLYCTALAGREIVIRTTDDAPAELVRVDRGLPITDGKSIFLPDSSGIPYSIEPFDYYQVLAAHQAGYMEFGTFEFDIDHFLGRMHPPLSTMESQSPILASHFELFFRLFPNRQLAHDLFYTLEDGRIDYRLRIQYPGLGRKLKQVSEYSLLERALPETLPLLESLVECLIRLSLGQQAHEHLPECLRLLWNEIAADYSLLMDPAATVIDSAIAAARIYFRLHQYPGIDGGVHEAVAFESTPPADSDGSAYVPSMPVEFRGQTDVSLVQFYAATDVTKGIQPEIQQNPLSAEALAELLKKGAKIKITGVGAEELTQTSGLFVTDLQGLLQEKILELSPEERKKLSRLVQYIKPPATIDGNDIYYYDEWDYLSGEYKKQWCCLQEVLPSAGSEDVVAGIKKENRALIASVRRQYQRIRPEMLRKVKRLRSGEELELDQVIEAVIDQKLGLTPSDRLYQNRERKSRDIAAGFLLDLSASTDECIAEEPELRKRNQAPPSRPNFSPFAFAAPADIPVRVLPRGTKRVIDIEREAVVIMAEALEGLGEEYAVCGFSGYGRDNVEFFLMKDFSEPYSPTVRRRIGSIEPKKSTRMGPAIRHLSKKLCSTGRRMKFLILLSDGYPQDFDYGPDRTSRDYGLHDTMMALQEARRSNVHTFCITIDQAGNDYLHEMCGGRDYHVVKRPSLLPRILPRIYRRLTF